MITKLMEFAGVHKKCFETMCMNPPELCESTKCDYWRYPELNPEKAWKLEEMILDKVKCFELRNHRYCYQMGFGGDMYRYEKAGTGRTRLEALASLIPQIDWSEQEMKQIKGILNG